MVIAPLSTRGFDGFGRRLTHVMHYPMVTPYQLVMR